ncbi:glycosyltransferase family 9 protein [Aquincola tertiaricarbonis]|uniref:glycosyltransferase family 9 protein n=1 Tax=Aquincola tertiaricarbonis TaxID=391953 RepID=UPI0006152CCA|nr:glycosyltransferase family 9 protein [Aquincola tertiaricarbonis]
MTPQPLPPLLPDGPRRIGVFRALMLGDMLCAVPALRAIAARWPEAELVLIGLPWAREWANRLPMVSRFVEFPGWPGLPERETDLAALPGFFQAMQAERFDLMIQLHGSGSIINNLLAACAPQRLAGFAEPDDLATEPELFTRWPRQGHEIERLLHLTDHLGLPRQGTGMLLPLTDDDRARAAALVGDGPPYACVHAGARFTSRRWPAERFAAVADRLAGQGLRIVLTGSEGEREVVQRVKQAMRHEALDLTARTDFWSLAALVEGARLLLSNDTGLSHVAAAVGAPSVVVSSGSDVDRWAPLDVQRHTVLWSPAPCRPCGHEHCPYQHECALAVSVDEVAAVALRRAVDTSLSARVAEEATA